MIYNANGDALDTAYDIQGQIINSAYDISGDIIYNARSLKIMTYNVGQWYTGANTRVPEDKKQEYYALQYGTFERNPVDVLFMQEYLNSWCVDDSSAQTDFIQPFFAYQEVTNPTGYVGHSICAKMPISNYISHQFTPIVGPYPSFETAQIVFDEKNITIINTHNNYLIAPQTDNVTDLLEAIAELDYFILCGDFNIDLAAHNTSSEQYQNSVQRFLDAGYNVGNCVVDWIPTYFGTSSATGGKFTDQIVTSPNITIKRIYADTAKLTDDIADKIDHLPLIAELIVN